VCYFGYAWNNSTMCSSKFYNPVYDKEGQFNEILAYKRHFFSIILCTDLYTQYNVHVLWIKVFLKISLLADDTTSAGKEFHGHMVGGKNECRNTSTLLLNLHTGKIAKLVWIIILSFLALTYRYQWLS